MSSFQDPWAQPPSPPARREPSWWSRIAIVLFGGLKFSKLLVSAGTMVVSLGVYASIWGWRFAAGFLGLLVAHEMGHYLAARQRGLSVGLPAFIPFIGAWMALREQPRSVETEAYIAFAGPFVGTLAAFAVYGWAEHTGDVMLLAIAYSGFILNLFNLLPLSPLDGGRITAVLSPRIWLLGVPILLGLMFYWPSPILFIIALLALPQVMRAWRYDPRTAAAAYYDVPQTIRVEYGVLYVGLAALLAVVTYEVHGTLAAVSGA